MATTAGQVTAASEPGSDELSADETAQNEPSDDEAAPIEPSDDELNGLADLTIDPITNPPIEWRIGAHLCVPPRCDYCGFAVHDDESVIAGNSSFSHGTKYTLLS